MNTPLSTPPSPTSTAPPKTTAPPPTSGSAIPAHNLPGWELLFADDFTDDVPLGQFPDAVSDRWAAYPYPWRDTAGQRSSDPTVGGWYHPGRTVSIHSGVLDIWLHTEMIDGSARRLVAAPQPKINGVDASGQLYGRYAVRFRADPVAGYKVAWLLWPDSGVWPRDGEIDFPEGNLTDTISGFMHWQGATSGDQQYWALSGEPFDEWNTAVIEWGPDEFAFYLNGSLISNASGGESRWTDRIPETPMHWVLQTETRTDGVGPSENNQGHVLIDWVVAWARA